MCRLSDIEIHFPSFFSFIFLLTFSTLLFYWEGAILIVIFCFLEGCLQFRTITAAKGCAQKGDGCAEEVIHDSYTELKIYFPEIMILYYLTLNIDIEYVIMF